MDLVGLNLEVVSTSLEVNIKCLFLRGRLSLCQRKPLAEGTADVELVMQRPVGGKPGLVQIQISQTENLVLQTVFFSVFKGALVFS